MVQKVNFNNLTGDSLAVGNTVIDGTGVSINGSRLGGSVEIYSNNASLPTSGLTKGSFLFSQANNSLYYSDGNGFYRMTLINESPSVTIANGDSVTIGQTGNTAILTYSVDDPEGLSTTITVSNSGISNTSVATVTHYESNNTIVFENLTMSESNTYSITVSATDGINIGVATANVIIDTTPPLPAVSATGGTTGTYTDGGITYKYHKFTSGGTFNVSSADSDAVFDMLVVAGGGGGGRGTTTGGVGEVGGGGGAGGLVYVNQKPLTGGSYGIVVGNAGLGYNSDVSGGEGGNSTAFGYSAIGGGGGAYRIRSNNYGGGDGGSGGGAHRFGDGGSSIQSTYSGDAYATGYGNDAGSGAAATPALSAGGGAGGVGSYSAGSAGGGGVASGGAGLSYNMDGTTRTYARGGDAVGGTSGGASNAGVYGGGGRGYRETSAGENGQPGIVIIRYQVPS